MRPETLKTTRKLAVDFAVIVIGVFVALAAETWWSEREQRQYERDIREDMIAEFGENIRILNSDISINEAVTQRLHALIGDTDASVYRLDDAALQPELNAIGDWAGFDPVMGSAQAFVESGNVATISDRQLRQMMARWAGLLEMRRRFNLQAVEFGLMVVVPRTAGANADGQWSTTERRAIHALLVHESYLRRTVLENQNELLGVAQEILDYLQQDEQ
ncbi:MAG: hypothetical protein AAF351_08025 [Pseudomonadota bacterium]